MASSTAELDLSPLSDSDVNSPSKRSLETHHKVQSVSQRSLNLKSYNVPRHFSMQSISSVQEAEKTLTQLVGDFEEGKLHAFGNFKMERILIWCQIVYCNHRPSILRNLYSLCTVSLSIDSLYLL